MKKTIIIPVHKIDKTITDYIMSAFASVVHDYNTSKQDGLIVTYVGPKKVIAVIEKIKFDFEIPKTITITYLENEVTDFQTQINKAVAICETEYFSILEFDDLYTGTWFKEFDEYLAEQENTSLFLPLNELVEQNNFIGFANESVWSISLQPSSANLGYLELEWLKEYFEFNTTGGFFNTKDFIEVGGLKPSMKLTFWYEFLMRLTYNGKRIFVIPKLGYQHTINREDSLMVEYREIVSDEGDWWVKTAQQEYVFKEDREKIYKEINK